MHQIGFRKYPTVDPFDRSKRLMENRLVHMQEEILKRFRTRQERDMMRATLRQLVQGESSLGGKIDKMRRILDGVGNGWDNQEEEETVDSMGRDCYEGEYRGMRKNYERGYGDKCNNQSTQYSPGYGHISTTKTPQNLSHLASLSNQHSSQSSLLSSLYRSPSNFPSQNPPNQKNPLSNSKHSFMSYYNDQDQIEENLFSFRTQDPTSPVRRFKGKENSGDREREEYRPILYDCYERKEMEKSQSQKKSHKKSKSKSSSKCPSPSKKRINYNGQSLTYTPRDPSFNQPSRKSKQKHRKQLTVQAQSKLYKRIQRRIELSNCVADTIDHSTSSADGNYMLNRVKHQLAARSVLANQVTNRTANTTHWH